MTMVSSQFNNSDAKRSLLPLLFFIFLFLGTGLYLHLQGVEYAFYQLPGHVAIIPALVLAVWLHRAPLTESIDVMIKGASNNNIILMCIIFLLAGAFSSVSMATGSVDAAVHAGLSLIPAQWLLPGLFIIASLVSLAMGTSMGTIAALSPIAVGLATETDMSLPLVAGVLMGGAMFGDNLSFISDTTIAATRTQGAEMKDKFRENVKIALPAMLLTILLLIFLVDADAYNITEQEINWTAVLPYAAILVLSILGMNVFLVLLLGVILAAAQGAIFADYAISNLGKDIASGFASMQEIFVLSMLIGALSEFIRQQGGLQWLLEHITRYTSKLTLAGNKAQQLTIAALALVSNFCIANNTVSIVLTGEVVKNLAQKYHITPRRSASVLDIFVCISQGIIPYGAQALLLAASFNISPFEVVLHSYYCFILFFAALIAIFVGKSNVPTNITEPLAGASR